VKGVFFIERNLVTACPANVDAPLDAAGGANVKAIYFAALQNKGPAKKQSLFIPIYRDSNFNRV